MRATLALVALCLSLAAGAADDRFDKKTPDSMTGFVAARDPTYVKECGSCHFAYSPGLLPARSWKRYLERLDRHFGESITLEPGARATLLDYLTKNAADVSPYEGSKTFMERIPDSQTPYRLNEVLLFRQMHRVVYEVINTQPRIKVKRLTNCNACHRKADEGSFGLEELYIPGVTGP